MAPVAFKATFSDLKVIKTRRCVQVVFEMPIEQFDAAYEVLGGLPNPTAERWFAIAALKQEAPGSGDLTSESNPVSPRLPSQAKRSFRDLPPQQQAGIRCEEPSFAAFLKEQWPDDWHESAADPAECVRLICRVKSRAELATNHKARVIWNGLNTKFEAWKAMENA